MNFMTNSLRKVTVSESTTIIEFAILVMATIAGAFLLIYQARFVYLAAITAILVWGLRLPRAFGRLKSVGPKPTTRAENFIDIAGLLIGGGILVLHFVL